MRDMLKAAGMIVAIGLVLILSVALILALVWSLRGEELADFSEPDRRPASEVVVSLQDPLDEELRLAEQEYREVKAQLQEAIGDKESQISDSKRGPLDEGLGIVQGAIQEIVMAISLNPENRSLKHILHDTYRKELNLLRKSLNLDESEGEMGAEAATEEVKSSSPPLPR